jgi:nicotinate-nucleotide adenylyltransferase
MNSIEYEHIYSDLSGSLREQLSKRRYLHSINTAEYMDGLCRRFFIDAVKGRISGLGHDLAREWPSDQIAASAERDGRPFNKLELNNPLLLHGRAAAQFLREHYRIADESILDAVRYHTLGYADFDMLGKALFCADYLEPGRNFISDEFRYQAEHEELDAMVALVIEHNCKRKGGIAESTRQLYHRVQADRKQSS